MPSRTSLGVLVTLTWTDLFGRFDRGRFLELFDVVPHDWLVTSLGLLGTIVANADLTHASQRGLVAELLSGDLRARALALFDRDERQILVHPEAIALGMKLAAIRSRSSNAPGDPSSLVPILAGLNELTPAEQSGGVAALLHIHASQQALWTEDLAREFDLFHRYESALSPSIRYGFGERFVNLTGLTAFDFSAYAFGIYAAYAQYKTARNLEGVNFRALAESTGERAANPDEFRRFLGLVSRTREQLQGVLTPDPAERLSLDDAVELQTAPLIRLENGGTAPVWLEWLEDKIGAAPRYILQNAIDGDAEMRSFRGALGQAFEDYIVDLLHRMFPSTGDAVVHTREGLPGCDAVILVGDAAIFLEFTVSEPSQHLMWRGDEAAIEDFAAHRLVGKGKLGQLAATLREYQADTLEVTRGRPRAHRIFPVIVGLTPLPLLLGLDRVVRASIGKANQDLARGVGDIRPVLFTCAKDWELLEVLVADGRIDLTGTLEGWLASGIRSGLSDYLLRDQGFAGTRNPSLAQRWDSLTSVLAPRSTVLYGLGQP